MSSMDWGTIWPIDNFKGHKVKKKMALAGLGAPSETTFEPIEIQSYTAKYISKVNWDTDLWTNGSI